jgi:hypothetical protein
MTPTGIRGVGQKSRRSEAIAMHRDAKLSISRIAEMMDEPVEQIQEWIYGKPRKQTQRQSISPASPEQRAKVMTRACIVCRKHAGSCHPAHLIDRSLAPTEMADDPRAVVPLCPEDHRAYDEEKIDLLPYLEPHFREEVAYAVEQVGIMRALRRLSGDRWVPVT